VLPTVQPSPTSDYDVSVLINECRLAMDDDFNTPIVLSHLFEGMRVINSAKEGSLKLTAQDIILMQQLYRDYFYQVLGLRDEESGETSSLTNELMDIMISMRAEAKANKDYATSDKLRDALSGIGVQIKDTKEGVSWIYEK
jgi:cysteinyl-tRNA synthetase